MREVLKSFIPRQHWAASNVDIVPTVANVKQLAQWGGVGVFTAFWMIGAFSFTFRFAISLSRSLSLFPLASSENTSPTSSSLF
jgi:hypothetical protein